VIVGNVVDRVWVVRGHPSMVGKRLVVVAAEGSDQKVVAGDPYDAGVGTRVLVTTDEAAHAVMGDPAFDAAVVGLVNDAPVGSEVTGP